ncbi:DMT family transporter [Maritalea porphyrae]|uniref:DMT family transporter n=1 Tax=Maritalea porphyrae TaxID=880732 RepID=UPI0022AFF650|nr:DMT family transporter [Maritalea porphyrae]MCZ4272702.1 DMT family transporter [Maritalea porphyrae]
MAEFILAMSPKNKPLVEETAGGSKSLFENSNFKKFLPFALLVVVGSFFGATTVNGKIAAQVGWHPIVFLAISGVLGGLLMMLGLRAYGHRPDQSRSVIKFSLISGFLFALPNIAFFSSVPHVGAGFVAMVTAFASVLTYMISVAMRTEQFKFSRAIGVGIALIGAVALSLGKFAGAQYAAVWVFVALMGPVFLALGNVYRSWAWPEGASPFALAPLMLIFAGLMSFALAVAMGEISFVVPTLQMSAIAGLQILIFAVGFAFYFVLQKIAGAVYLSQIGPIIALVGTGLGISLLGEVATLSLMIGGTAIVSGVLIFNFTQ